MIPNTRVRLQVSEVSHGETGQEKSKEDRDPGSIRSPDSRANRARGGRRARRGRDSWEKLGAELSSLELKEEKITWEHRILPIGCFVQTGWWVDRRAGGRTGCGTWTLLSLPSGGPKPSKTSSRFQVPSHVIFLNVYFFIVGREAMPRTWAKAVWCYFGKL